MSKNELGSFYADLKSIHNSLDKESDHLASCRLVGGKMMEESHRRLQELKRMVIVLDVFEYEEKYRDSSPSKRPPRKDEWRGVL